MFGGGGGGVGCCTDEGLIAFLMLIGPGGLTGSSCLRCCTGGGGGGGGVFVVSDSLFRSGWNIFFLGFGAGPYLLLTLVSFFLLCMTGNAGLSKTMEPRYSFSSGVQCIR